MVSGGRAMGSEEGFNLIYELAELLVAGSSLQVGHGKYPPRAGLE